MDLSRERFQLELGVIDQQGWDSPAGVRLLHDLRAGVVRPVVRASRLTGPAADQAESSAWAAAWEAIRRPTAREAVNPAGMVWSAVRRTVGAEVGAALPVAWTPSTEPDPGAGEAASATTARTFGAGGPLLELIVDLLVAEGWPQESAGDAIALLADEPGRGAWRTVAARIGVPAWQVRRVAALVLGVDPAPGLLRLVVELGPGVLAEPGARAAARACRVRWLAGPAEHLAQLAALLDRGASVPPALSAVGPQDPGRPGGCDGRAVVSDRSATQSGRVGAVAATQQSRSETMSGLAETACDDYPSGISHRSRARIAEGSGAGARGAGGEVPCDR